MRRVSRGPVVILTFDPGNTSFWLIDYLPALAEIDRGQMPRRADFEAVLGPVAIVPVPIPHDCQDGLLCAYWRRPAAYLDPGVRAGMSSFARLGDVSGALRQLEADLASGAWARRYAHLLAREACDFGYHLVVARCR